MGWRAPELESCSEGAVISSQADVFSLGCLFMEMALLCPPRPGKGLKGPQISSDLELGTRHSNFRTLRKHYGDAWGKLVSRCMRPDPAERMTPKEVHSFCRQQLLN